MVSPATLAAFGLVSIPLILAPGPSVLFVVGRALSVGRIGALLSVLGNALGAMTAALAIAIGLGSVVQQSVVVFTIVKVVGAGYLVYLGIQSIRSRNELSTTDAAPLAPRSTARLLSEGFVVGVTNPKTIVFLIAVLPQFVDYSAGGVPLQMIQLAAVFMGIALISDSGWAVAAGVARDWFARSPSRIARLRAAGGVVMIGLGAATLFVGHSKG